MINCERKPIVVDEMGTLAELAIVAAGGVPLSALLTPNAESSLRGPRVWATKPPGNGVSSI